MSSMSEFGLEHAPRLSIADRSSGPDHHFSRCSTCFGYQVIRGLMDFVQETAVPDPKRTLSRCTVRNRIVVLKGSKGRFANGFHFHPTHGTEKHPSISTRPPPAPRSC